jgi:hypothetical protein
MYGVALLATAVMTPLLGATGGKTAAVVLGWAAGAGLLVLAGLAVVNAVLLLASLAGGIRQRLKSGT